MELSDEIAMALEPTGAIMTVDVWESDIGNKFSTFYILYNGAVWQFTAPYPSVDEDYNNTFTAKVIKEIS